MTSTDCGPPPFQPEPEAALAASGTAPAGVRVTRDRLAWALGRAQVEVLPVRAGVAGATVDTARIADPHGVAGLLLDAIAAHFTKEDHGADPDGVYVTGGALAAVLAGFRLSVRPPRRIDGYDLVSGEVAAPEVIAGALLAELRDNAPATEPAAAQDTPPRHPMCRCSPLAVPDSGEDAHADPEVRAMAAAVAALEPLEPAARDHVVAYLYRRYCGIEHAKTSRHPAGNISAARLAGSSRERGRLMRKASIGDIVHVLVDPAVNNGSDIAPAIISRVHSDDCVNLRVLFDEPVTVNTNFPPRGYDWLQRCPLYESREALNAASPEPYGAFWPPQDDAGTLLQQAITTLPSL